MCFKIYIKKYLSVLEVSGYTHITVLLSLDLLWMVQNMHVWKWQRQNFSICHLYLWLFSLSPMDQPVKKQTKTTCHTTFRVQCQWNNFHWYWQWLILTDCCLMSSVSSISAISCLYYWCLHGNLLKISYIHFVDFKIYAGSRRIK